MATSYIRDVLRALEFSNEKKNSKEVNADSVEENDHAGAPTHAPPCA